VPPRRTDVRDSQNKLADREKETLEILASVVFLLVLVSTQNSSTAKDDIICQDAGEYIHQVVVVELSGQ